MSHVSILIVGFRNPADIHRCLGALALSTHTDFDVVICENGGDEAYRALVSTLPGALPTGQCVRVINAGANLGYAGGVNRAMAAAPDASAWWILNPDTEPEADALSAALKRLEAGDCQAVGSTVYLPNSTVQSHGGLWRPWLARAVSLGHGTDLTTPVDSTAIERSQSYLNGACMLVSREFLQTAGPMREDYFLYCEEVEWCLRAVARGARLGFAPESRVLHEGGATTGSYTAVRDRPKTPVYLNERNRLLVTRDCFPRRLPVAALGALVVLALKYGRRGAWRQLGYALAGWKAGLARRRGIPAWLSA
jgi:N-acetylglucosaminyl-diphospho-decaprenol L-rhamnosyltransferase